MSKLAAHTYLSPTKPIPSAVPGWEGQATWPATTATLLTSRDDALLVDALMTTAESRALGDWFDGLVRWPSTIYVTHGHADHFFGATPLLTRRPQLRLVALPAAVQVAAQQVGPALLPFWRSVFPNQLSDQPDLPRALAKDEVLLDGRARAVDVGRGDVECSSVVHVADLDLVVAGDVVYNDIHPWLAGSTPSSRAAWLEALDRVEKLGASTIIAGHKDAAAPDDDAHRTLDTTREYLADFDRAAAASESPTELFNRVMDTHPDLGNPYTLWVAAHDQPQT